MTVLDEIISGVLIDLEQRKKARPLDEVIDSAARAQAPLDPVPSFRMPGISVIAEVKRNSPSKGKLAVIADPAELAEQYQVGGAAAVSVLTEQRRFGGSLADLDAVRARVNIPVLRKDFIVTPYQVYEARAHGADLILLIVAALTHSQLQELHALATGLGMRVLVETHTPEEVMRAVDLGAELIGVNNRNLKTLEVDLAQFARLAELIPDEVIKVAESGILSLEDAQQVANVGADVILVGEALVRHDRPADAVARFRTVERYLSSEL